MDKNKYSVFGGSGFVLGEFCRQFPDEVTVVPRNEVIAPTPKIIFGISTIHNYHVFDNPMLDIDTNLRLFMEVLSKNHDKYDEALEFILISTWFVYGVESSVQHPLREDMMCNPRGFYSITARAREQLLISYCETFNLKYKILRLSNVMGVGDKKVSAQKNAIQWLMQKIIRGEEVELYDNGNVWRAIIDVRDCARAIRFAIQDSKYKIYNVTNGVSQRVRDIMEHTIKYSGSKSNLWDNLHKSEFHGIVQSKNAFMDGTRIREAGYTPQYSILDTVEVIIDDYKKG